MRLTSWHMITPETFEGVLREVQGASQLVHDFEASGLDHFKETVISAQIGVPETDNVFYFPLRHARGENLPNPHQVMKDMWEIIREKRVVGKNWSFDIRYALHEGLKLPGVWDEVEGAAVMFDVNEAWLELETLAYKYVNKGAGKEEAELEEKVRAAVPWAEHGNWKSYMWYMTPQDVFAYGCADIRDTWALHEFYRAKRTEKEEKAYQMFCRFLRVILKMELRGMLVDREELTTRLTECQTNMAQAAAEFKKMVPRSVNLASSEQVAKSFGLRHADDIHLSALKRPEADVVLSWRGYEKARGTYYEPLQALLNKEDKRR